MNCRNILLYEQRQVQDQEWQRFFTVSLDLMCIAGFDGYFKRLNPAWEKVLGFSCEELLAKPFIEFVHPEDRAITQAEALRLIAGADNTADFENRYRCQNGSYRWFAWRTKTSVEEQLLYAVARDITQEKQIKAQLQQSNDQIIRIVESITDAFFALDCQGRFTYLNAEAEQLLQKHRDELIGQCVWQFPGAIGSIFYTECYRAISEQVVIKFEGFYPPSNRWFAVHAYPAQEGLAVYFNDITERKQVEEALRQSEQAAQAQAEELVKHNALKDDFLNTVAHDLRGPAANIKIATQVLKIALSQEQLLVQPIKINRYLQILQDECDRQITLINDLLDLQRLDAGLEPIAVETIYLKTWLSQIIEPFQARVSEREQMLQLDLPVVSSPLVSVPSSLERILVELLNNACKYTPPGERIILQVNVQSEIIQFKVINTGVEIPNSELLRIFDKFYRIKSFDRWKQGGSGLGLSLVQKLTEQLGGTIQVASESGQTCFTIELPINSSG